jgi:thiol-disulfide isomerase/thioredoxin
MRQTFVILLFGLIFTGALQAQKQESYLTSKFISGCPTEIEPYTKQLGFSNLSYLNLETGIDTLKVVFGRCTHRGQNGYWISSYINNNLVTFSAVSLLKNELSQSLTNIVDIGYDNSSKKISVQLIHNPSSDEIQYLWVNNNQKSKIATIVKIEKPIQKGKRFPPTKFTSLNGDSISVKDFIGKIIVINWWATGCAPCRQEIPSLNKLVEKYKSKLDVVFLAVAYDNKKDLEYYLTYNEFKYSQTFGDKEVSKLFGESFPKNIIVNPQGVITYYSEGGNENRYMEIDNELKRQMNKK